MVINLLESFKRKIYQILFIQYVQNIYRIYTGYTITRHWISKSFVQISFYSFSFFLRHMWVCDTFFFSVWTECLFVIVVSIFSLCLVFIYYHLSFKFKDMWVNSMYNMKINCKQWANNKCMHVQSIELRYILIYSPSIQ